MSSDRTDRVADLIAKRFIERSDVKAEQQADGAYHPVKSKFTRSDLRDHLTGSKTYGNYLLKPHEGGDATAKFFAYDIDLEKQGFWRNDLDEVVEINPREVWADPMHPARPWLTIQLRCMAEGLALRVRRVLDIPVAISYSGNKGVHVYGFTGSAPAGDVRDAGLHTLQSWGCFEATKGSNFFKHEMRHDDPVAGYASLSIEVFPKQAKVESTGFGNLLRLPCGTHRKSGERGFFVDLTKGYDTMAPAKAEQHLADGADPWAPAK